MGQLVGMQCTFIVTLHKKNSPTEATYTQDGSKVSAS